MITSKAYGSAKGFPPNALSAVLMALDLRLLAELSPVTGAAGTETSSLSWPCEEVATV